MANFNNLIKTGMSALNARHRIKSKFNKTLCDQFSKFILSATFNVVILTRLQVELFKEGKKHSQQILYPNSAESFMLKL